MDVRRARILPGRSSPLRLVPFSAHCFDGLSRSCGPEPHVDRGRFSGLTRRCQVQLFFSCLIVQSVSRA